MVERMTQRDLKKYADNVQVPIYKIGYCGAAHLLRGLEPFAYNAGAYGWNWDAYQLPNCIICTGYRNLTGNAVDYDVVNAYEKRAAELTGWGCYNALGLAEIRHDFEKALLGR